MKNEKGITLISLIIYVIALTIAIAVISNITASFYSNVNEFDSDTENAVSITKFNMHFVRDIKRDGAKIVTINNNLIVLSYYNENGLGVNVEYSIQNNDIYRNKVKICDNIDEAVFTKEDENIIKIKFKIGDFEKNTTYVIENNKITNNNSLII